MNKYQLDAKLSHLAEVEIDNLIGRYYKGEKIATLLSEFNIQCIPRSFVKLLPLVIHKEFECPACKSPMGLRLHNRATHARKSDELECINCEHSNLPSCCCDYCKKLEVDAEARIKASFLKYWKNLTGKHSSIRAEELSFRAAVSLVALVRCCELKKDGSFVHINNNTIPFAPKGNLGRVLLAELMNSNLIAPIANSTSTAFNFENGEIVSFNLNALDWKIHGENETLLISEIEDYGLSGNWPENWYGGEKEKLRMELALAECREFYEYCLSDRSLPYIEGAAIDNMLLNLLRDHSVAQCYGIIWSGAKSASDFKIRNKVSSQHAANYMSGACLRWADKARAEGWDLKSFKRNFNLPRSMLSYVLYDVMLKTGEKGFTEPVIKM